MPFRFVDEEVESPPETGKYRFVEQPDTGVMGELKPGQRQKYRALAGGVEQVLSAPRRLGETLESLIPEKALQKGAEAVGLGEGAKTLLEARKKYSPTQILPSKEKVHELTKYIFGDQLESKNETEKVIGNIGNEFVDMITPLGGQVKPLRAALTAIGANLAPEIVGKFGGSESQKDWTKLGTYVLSAFIQPGKAEELKNSLYKTARSARPQDASIGAQQIVQDVNNLETLLNYGGSAPWKEPVLTKIQEIRKASASGQIELNELEAFKQTINDVARPLWDTLKDTSNVKKARRQFEILSKDVDKALDAYGKYNPDWHKAYRQANEAHGAIESSKKFGRWLTKNWKELGLTHAGLSGLGAYLGGAPALASAAGGTAAVVPSVLTIQQIVRMAKSPTLRKYFTKLYAYALQDNLRGAQTEIKKIKAASKKEED